MLNQCVSPCVLIVDDEHVIADTLAVILRQRGFNATAVYSGETAVEAAGQLRPNVLISDVVMGGMSGIEAAILISSALPECKILLFSGNASTADLLQHAQAKGYRFEMLAKPVHPQVILDHLTA
jgi:CheY-like chemotaxis protein